MRYFETLPNIYSKDSNGNYVVAKNLLSKIALPSTVLYNPLIFYQYDIQDSDTPESIANKYYGDPQWNWPMNQKVFNDYLNDKYSALATANGQSVLAYTQGTIQNYIKSVSVTDNLSQQTTTTLYYIDSNAYANVAISTSTAGNGAYTLSQSVTKYPQYILDYENQQNEAKRTIYLINSMYVTTIESQFVSLMRQ